MWWVIGFSIISGICYRLGGWEKGNRLYRLLGCSLSALCATCIVLGFHLSFWWAYLLTFGLTAGAVVSYWGLDEQKWGYWAHGLGLSLAMAPIAYIAGHWLAFVLRCFVLTALITIWSEFTKWDVLEEFGRGFFIAITILLFLL